MINKRLLIKNLLAFHDENSFYDKKRQLNLHTHEGKGKFLKHICALSNANPFNNAYIIVGVEDDNQISGDDFFDDSKIQNLVNAFLVNPPLIVYDNVPFPELKKGKQIGLVTIKPNKKISHFKKAIYNIPLHAIYYRIGSNSTPIFDQPKLSKTNLRVVSDIENVSRNSIKHSLDGVINFINSHPKETKPTYKVFKELFIVCWAGNPKKIKNDVYLSRVDIELVNEGVKLFYSNLDEVVISYNQNQFIITEYVVMGLNDKTSYYPLERKTINFFNNGYYKIENEFLFIAPQYNANILKHIYNSALGLMKDIINQDDLKKHPSKNIEDLPYVLMICYLNHFKNAKKELIALKDFYKTYQNGKWYNMYKETLRILRKVKYEAE
jgi:hypothetical protein